LQAADLTALAFMFDAYGDPLARKGARYQHFLALAPGDAEAVAVETLDVDFNEPAGSLSSLTARGRLIFRLSGHGLPAFRMLVSSVTAP
jgi:hypothetical protein